jgi:phosphopantothenate---cysteine ligase (CTP)
MNILVTAGNTRVLIDQVRCITNIFTGRTGASIALEAQRRGHHVTLLTSRPETVSELSGPLGNERWRLVTYQTFADLDQAMCHRLGSDTFDTVIHSAAVSDYLADGVFVPAPGTRLTDDNSWQSEQTPALVNRDAAKIKSAAPELWLRLKPAPKLIDKVRSAWGFRGILVKFKLEVGIGDARLLEVAEQSRVHSRADLMVANTLEGASSWAFVGPFESKYVRVERQALAARVVDAIENLETRRS